MLSWIHVQISGLAVLPDFAIVSIAASFLFAKQAMLLFVVYSELLVGVFFCLIRHQPASLRLLTHKVC